MGYHPSSNLFIERFHTSLHAGLSNYINAANTNWDHLIPFFLMAYRATPNSVTGFSPYYLLHGRETEIPNNDNLKVRVATGNPDLVCYLNTLKTSPKKAYEVVAKSNRRSHQRT
jgi:hypothetical protein